MTRTIVPIAQLTRRLPEAGRIRIGKKNGTRPTAIGEFRFTSHDETALEQIAALYGGTVRPWSDPKAAEGQHEVITDADEIRIVLPPDPLGGTPIYEMWSGGGCERRCDGLTCQKWQTGPDGPEPVDVPCVCAERGEVGCKPVTRLCVILPEVRFAGVWRLDTKSWNAAQELPGMVDMIQQQQSNGLPYGTMAIRHRRSVIAGKTSKFLVPVLGVGASIEQLAAGAANLGGLGAGGGAVAEIGPGPTTSTPPADALPAAAAERPAPAHHDPDDDVVEAEVIDDDPVDTAVIQARIDRLGSDEKKDLTAWWRQQGIPALKSRQVTAEQATAIHAALDAYEPQAGATKGRNAKMHALVAEAWPDEAKDELERKRKHSIAATTNGRTESSKELTDDEWTQLFEALEEIKAGAMRLKQSANGGTWGFEYVGGAS